MDQKEKIGIRLVMKSISFLLFFIVLTFVTAGRLDYWQGWTFNGLNALFLLITYIALRDRKDLIRERLKPGKGIKKWDKCYSLVSAPIYLVMFIVSVLDAARFSWPPTVPVTVIVLGGVLYSIGQVLLLWAKRANRFFSSVVRIQADRQQTVCRDGPYRFVRHPGYAGGLIYTLATPVLLGSYWGLIPAVLTIGPLVIRAHLEDKTLHEELDGYAAYAREVPFRLIPRIW
jgi:protein-S-isoprenylcysteine O-methyltransferase Ste14